MRHDTTPATQQTPPRQPPPATAAPPPPPPPASPGPGSGRQQPVPTSLPAINAQDESKGEEFLDEQPPPVNVFRQEAASPGRPFNPRRTRRLVWLALLLVPPLLLLIAAGLSGGPRSNTRSLLVVSAVLWPLLCFFRWAPLGGLVRIGIPLDWLARFLTSFLIDRLRCPRCHGDLPAVSIWSAGGYTDHRERHILRFRNPLTGDYIGRTDCPRCGSTILV